MDGGELLIYTHLNILGSFSLNDSPKNKYHDDANDNSYCYNYNNYIDIISSEGSEGDDSKNGDADSDIDENQENQENVNGENEYKLIKDQRDLGFVMLSNPDKVSTHLKKTKFCQVLIDKGHCGRSICNFAHSVHEIIFPECAFRDNCRKKHLCKFKHPSETSDEYKKRVKFSIPQNIKY